MVDAKGFGNETPDRSVCTAGHLELFIRSHAHHTPEMLFVGILGFSRPQYASGKMQSILMMSFEIEVFIVVAHEIKKYVPHP